MPDVGTSGKRAGRKTASAAAAASSITGAAVDVKEAAAVQARADILWQAFIAIGEHGALFANYAALNMTYSAHFHDMLLANFKEVPLSTLRGVCSALRRWRDWAEQAEASWTAPTAILVALWLRSLRPRGPTAAHGALANLSWLEDRIGLRVWSSSPIVRQQGSIAGGHVPVQAVLLRVRVWVLFEEWLQASSPFIRAVALAWLLCTSGALRFAHLQRSTLLRTSPAGLFLRAARGKARTKGVRRPLDWTAPRLGLTGVDYGVFLDRHLGEVGQQGFLLPDIGPRRCSVLHAEHFQPWAMTLPKFMAITSSLLQGPPASLSPTS